jgi:hypothetical protein
MLFYESKTTIPKERHHHVRLLGTGASAPTREIGQGITVTRSGVGVYKLTFAENPGTFIRFGWGLGAATPGDVKGQTVTRDTFDTTAGVYSIEVALWSSAFAADDLQANEYMDLEFVFSEMASP